MRNFSLKTKANYRHNSRRARLQKIITLVVISLVVLWLLGGLVGGLTSMITVPLYSLKTWATDTSNTIPGYFVSRTSLLEKITSLESDLSVHRTNSTLIEQLRRENDDLRSLLSIADVNRIAAGVIAQPPHVPYDVLLIDRGSSDGVQERAVVYHTNDEAIGFIGEVYQNSALVILFSTPGSSVTAYVFGPDIYTTAHGEGGGVTRISVPQGIELAIDDLVVIPSLEIGVLGVIDEVVSVPTQPQQHGYIVQTTPLQSLRSVSVSSRVVEPLAFEEVQERVLDWNYGAFVVDVPDELLVESSTGTSTATSSDEIEEVTEE